MQKRCTGIGDPMAWMNVLLLVIGGNAKRVKEGKTGRKWWGKVCLKVLQERGYMWFEFH